MTIRLLLKSLLAALLMPGTVVGIIPFFILRSTGDLERSPAVSLWSLLSAIIGAGGLIILIRAISGFAVHGGGTLAPVDPPRVLVLRGLYNRTRNPMYVGVLCILAAEAMLFRSIAILVYAAIVFVLFHLFVILYEEPHLRRLFGSEYDEYCLRVPRWPHLVSSGGRKKT